MDLLTMDDLRKLISHRGLPAISIYMPAIHAGMETRQNHIRFKNLIHEAEQNLSLRGFAQSGIREILTPGYRILNDPFFWLHQSDGLAVFISPGFSSYYRLPVPFREKAVVGPSFHVKPLVSFLSEEGRYFLLVLSQKSIRLFEGSHYGLSQIKLHNVPPNLSEALAYDAVERSLQLHSPVGLREGSAVHAPVYHSHDGLDDVKEQLFRFFRMVDRGVHTALKEERAPMLLAGVEYILPIYREANTYLHLLDEKLTGNFDRMNPEELHQCAWPALQPFFSQGREDAVDQYRQYSATPRALKDLRRIVPAAYNARVESLFIAAGSELWGAFRAESGTVELHSTPSTESEDLVDFSAVHTLLNRGSVFVLDPERMPDDSAMAAVLRF